jgi:hypothetical protein
MLCMTCCTGDAEKVDGTASSNAGESNAPPVMKQIGRYEKLMRTVFRQDPVWLNFKDPRVEQAFILNSANQAWGVRVPQDLVGMRFVAFVLAFLFEERLFMCRAMQRQTFLPILLCRRSGWHNFLMWLVWKLTTVRFLSGGYSVQDHFEVDALGFMPPRHPIDAFLDEGHAGSALTLIVFWMCSWTWA